MNSPSLSLPIFRAFDSAGLPLAGGLLYTYVAGSGGSMNQLTYSDVNLTVPNANPVVLDTTGTAVVRLDPTLAYELVLENSSGATQWTIDGYTTSFLTQSQFNTFLDSVTFVGASGDAYSDVYFKRTAAYSGGTPGHVSTCLTVETDVTGTGAANYEWPFLSVLNNSATGGQNVAGYFQANRVTNGGPTWAGVFEVIEKVATNNPTHASVGVEIDLRANGLDSGGGRVGCDVVITKRDAGGVACQASWGYRIQNGGDGVSNVGYGYGYQTGAIAAVGFDTSQGSMTSAAYQMALNQPIIFDGPTNQHHKLMVQTGGLGLDYLVSGTLQTRLLATGGVQVLTAQVVGARSTGWTAMTGTPDKSTVFDTSTVTLAQLAGRVMSLQAALTTHGLIGT